MRSAPEGRSAVHRGQPSSSIAGARALSAPAMTGPVAFREPVMSLVSMTASVEQAAVAPAAPKARSACAGVRPALGLLLPVALAVCWEIAVRHGLVQRPPGAAAVGDLHTHSSISPRTGELQRHALATLCAGGGRLCLRRCGRHGVRRDRRLFGADRIAWSIRRCRPCARFPRSPGCRCSSSGSASSRPPRSS